MKAAEFLELFIKELGENAGLREYYRLLNNKERFFWRKLYLEQRLEYVEKHCTFPAQQVWDVGCGYGTTSIFLALNGHHVHGNTLEFYYKGIDKRLDFWSRYGNLDKLKIEYANVFDMEVPAAFFDTIVAQDTLHHLEPVNDAVSIFNRSLKPGGKLIAVEENGLCAFIGLKNFAKRGFKRIDNYYDERLKKSIPFGNENARSIQHWRKIFANGNMKIPAGDVEYVRLFPHFCVNKDNYRAIREREKNTWINMPRISDYLFFGINFTAIHDIKTATP